MDTNEMTLKAGDVCLDCQQQGLVKRLRYFKINLNGDTLLKCESNECMYPYNDEMSSSDEEKEDVQNLTETNSIKFIDDFIQQYSNETAIHNSNYDLSTNANISEQASTFDITFLDSFSEIESENVCKNEILDNKTDVEIIENQYLTLPNLNTLEYEIPSSVVVEEGSKLCKSEIPKESVDFLDNKTNVKIIANEQLTLPNFNSFECEITPAVVEKQHDNQILTLIDCKPKIDIQSIETIKRETPLYNIFNSSLKTITTCREISATSSYSPTPTSTTAKFLQLLPNNCNSFNKSITPNVSNISTLNFTKISPMSLKNTTPLQKTTKKNKKSRTIGSDNPKANIMKGRDFLKKLAIVNEKIPYENPKTKDNRSKMKIANEVVIENEVEPSPSFSGDSDYSLDMVSKMLMANKMTRGSKN